MSVCVEFRESVEETVFDPVDSWITKTERWCEDLPWPFSWFCRVVTTVIKVVTWVARIVVRIVITVICYPITIIVNIIGFIINIIKMIPIVGPIYKWVIGAIIWGASQVIGFIDALAGLVGIRPTKHLRLHVVILMRRDHALTVDPDVIEPCLDRVKSIFRDRAQVKVHTTVHMMSSPAPNAALQVEHGVGALIDDLSEAGMYFQSVIRDAIWEHGGAFTIRVFAPIIAFAVDDVTDKQGCSLGPFTDYLTIDGRLLDATPWAHPQPSDILMDKMIQASSPTLAHEMGHACALTHSDDITNMMHPGGLNGARIRGTNLSPMQRAVLRSSPHVTYL